MKRFIEVFLILALFVSGCAPKSFEKNTIQLNQDFWEELPKEVAKLPTLELSSIESFEHFEAFAAAVNALIKVLNEKSDGVFDIPLLDVSMDSYQKLSRAVTEYGPLLKTYNDVINSARDFEQGKTGIKEFYQASAIFGLEIAIISGTVFYPFSFKTVGILYRAVGLNRLAFKYGPIVSTILREAHWALRNALVESSSLGVEMLLNLVKDAHEKGVPISLDGFLEFIKKYPNGE